MINDNAKREKFRQFAQRDLRLLLLEQIIMEHAKANQTNADYCANEFWYTIYKPMVVKWVGWESKNPELNTNEAYDVVYQYLLDLLPDCNHRGICRG